MNEMGNGRRKKSEMKKWDKITSKIAKKSMTKCFKRIQTNDNFMSEWFLCLIYASVHLKKKLHDIHEKWVHFVGACCAKDTQVPRFSIYSVTISTHITFHAQCTYILNEFRTFFERPPPPLPLLCQCVRSVFCMPKSERPESKRLKVELCICISLAKATTTTTTKIIFNNSIFMMKQKHDSYY